MTALPPRFPLTPDQIDRVVAAFYARVRRDPALGPVFRAHVGESDAAWAAHEDKIARFWKNAILHEGGYDGRPMAVHRAAGDVAPEHFPVWLGLFDEILAQNLPPQSALAWSALAHRIGGSFRMGVEDARRPADAVPRLG
ncbi:group III truncated hemoglobin [Solirhodobacter olei]|uniref:group III truncated hemoglobin n=1 Tax=Solirhodobacter olei TaxID=2493082 RepID=UPI000FD920B7|nr:group III truncated hemoglobin [Solirhodobacter olei]